MNSKERLRLALDHREGDRVPLDLGAGICCKMHVAFYRRLLDHFGIAEEPIICNKTGQTALTSDAVLERLECDVRTPYPCFRAVPASAGSEWEEGEYLFFRDSWGTVFRMPKEKPLYYDMYAFPLADAEAEEGLAYPWPDPGVVDPAGVEQAEKYQAAGFPVTFIDHYGNGFLQTGPKLYGFDNWLMMLALEEDAVKAHLERLLDMKMRQYDAVFAGYGSSLDVVCESDDLGIQTGPFVSPDMFRTLFKPYWKRLFEYIKSKSGAKVLLHSCGSCEQVLGDLIDVGLDILNPVQISAADMDPYHLKKEYGRDLVFWGGGIDTQRILPHGSPQEIRDNVKRNIDALAKDGGFVFATVHNVQADVPVENFLCMWETFMQHRNYS